ncbi:MAG: AraC family transcriptional regulator [Bacteroidia bacterium]|nr:AraC family transcriptional regulator [Bacteroidia bacterium]
MAKTLFIVLLSIYLALILIDTVKCFPSIFPADFLIKVLPQALMMTLALLDLLLYDDGSWRIRLASFLLAANAITLNAPSSFDKPKGFFICFFITLFFFLSFLVLSAERVVEPEDAYVLPLGVTVVVFLQSVLNRQDNDNVAPFDLPLLLDLTAALTLYLCAEGKSASSWQLPAISSVLYVSLVYVSMRKYMGGFYWLMKKRPAKDTEESCPTAFKALNEGSRMDEMYARLERYMADEQPYLRDDLTLAELSRAMLTNKTYLSRTINQKSGRNYCTYINWYRINYSLKIIEKDTRVKVVELAVMSGFHSVASYNMAFRLFMGDTPSEYIRTQKAKALKSAQTPFQDSGTGAKT